MDDEEKEITRKTWKIMGIILLILVLGIGGYYIWFQRQQMQEMSELFAIEKELLLEDFDEVLFQFDHSSIRINKNDTLSQLERPTIILNNDSIFIQLATEREKVQRLQEELRTVKSTNARRINELKQELETLRKIAQNFVVQIDSLDSENKKLKDENKQVTQQYQQVANRAARLTQEKNMLTERVQLASRLDAVNIQLLPINNKGKTVKLDKADKLMLTFIIAKNITAPVGEQMVYVRLMKPDDDILLKTNYRNFRFENKDIPYSLNKSIEYDGDEQNVVLYWDIEEYLSPGTYRVAIFASENQIGQKAIKL